jgi:hypothetical protein
MNGVTAGVIVAAGVGYRTSGKYKRKNNGKNAAYKNSVSLHDLSPL